MIIRKGTKEDIPFTAGLWLKMAKEKNYDNANVRWWLEISYNLIATGVYYFFVADDGNNHLGGFIDYVICPDPATGEIQGLGRHFYVDPAYRYKRVAHKLLNALYRDAKMKKVTSLITTCLPPQKTFWVKRGSKLSELLMIKKL